MTHPYPPHWPSFEYKGRYRYALTYTTDGRHTAFTDVEIVDLVLGQILRAASEEEFSVIAYCFMPDHVHLVVRGESDKSDCKGFIRVAKQYSGFYYSRLRSRRLWQRYGHDRVIRDDRELAMIIGYIMGNPVRAGLAEHPSEYPFLGSQRYRVAELLEWCEYSEAVL